MIISKLVQAPHTVWIKITQIELKQIKFDLSKILRTLHLIRAKLEHALFRVGQYTLALKH